MIANVQGLSLKLGVATDRDLAQACRSAYRPWINVCLWIIMEARAYAMLPTKHGDPPWERGKALHACGLERLK